MNLAGHCDRRLSENYFEPCFRLDKTTKDPIFFPFSPIAYMYAHFFTLPSFGKRKQKQLLYMLAFP